MRRTALNTTASAERPYISKSEFLWGGQCRKLLWYAYNAKDQIPEPDAAQQAIFDQGHEVGALAKSLYPGGIEVSADVTDFEQVLQKSLEAVKQRKPLFEAGFVYNGRFGSFRLFACKRERWRNGAFSFFSILDVPYRVDADDRERTQSRTLWLWP
jgi:hypothetical protein